MTVEEWELIAHIHAYRKDGNVPKQERYVQATYIRYVEIGNTRRFNPVYGNVSTGNTLKTSSGVTSSGRVSLPVYRHVGGNGVSELAAS